jgi:hypothetical protein
MCYTRYTLEELQCLGMTNDQEAIYELGRRALTMDFCLSDVEYCKHKVELLGIQWDLENEVPPQCPRCHGWLTEK